MFLEKYMQIIYLQIVSFIDLLIKIFNHCIIV
jgi:hypothetical protein